MTRENKILEIKLLRAKQKKKDKRETTESLLHFTKYFFKKRFGRSFVVGEHHIKIIDKLEKVMTGEIKNLIINIAPRYSKTELAVKNFIAYCLALNAESRFLHLSFSDVLALDNSEDVKDFVQSHEYQELFPDVKIKKDSKSKKKWYTTKGGGIYATSAGGQVTGFGAGKVDLEEEDELFGQLLDELNAKKGFGGAIIIDDPVKPEDATSETKRNRINERFDSTIRSRVNSRNTPIIIIMQRVHEDDLCGYILKNEPDDWEVLELPAIKEDGTALWPFKHTIEELRSMEKKMPTVFRTQYMQQPVKPGGNKIRGEWFGIINKNELPFNPEIAKVNYIIDGAFTEETKNDPSAVMAYVMHKGFMYIFNCHGIWKELYEFLPYFKEYADLNYHTRTSTVWIEPKASGKSMRSMLRKEEYGSFNAREISNEWVRLGKYNRVENAEATLAAERVILVKGNWNKPFIDECEAFPNGVHDDMVDDLCYAIHIEFIKPKRKGVKRSS